MKDNINIIKNARKKENMTQQELADAIGVSKPYINKIEKGITKKPSISILNKIAIKLKINNNELFNIYDYEIEDFINEQNINYFFYNYEIKNNLKNKYFNNKYDSKNIISDYKNGNIGELDAIYLFIKLLKEK